MIATGKKISASELDKLSRDDLMQRYDAADLCSSAYARPQEPMQKGVRKVLSIAHAALLSRQETIRLLRRQLSLANEMIDELKVAKSVLVAKHVKAPADAGRVVGTNLAGDTSSAVME